MLLCVPEYAAHLGQLVISLGAVENIGSGIKGWSLLRRSIFRFITYRSFDVLRGILSILFSHQRSLYRVTTFSEWIPITIFISLVFNFTLSFCGNNRGPPTDLCIDTILRTNFVDRYMSVWCECSSRYTPQILYSWALQKASDTCISCVEHNLLLPKFNE